MNPDNDFVYKYYKKKGILEKILFENLTDYPIDLFYKYNFTPNILTTFSFAFQLVSIIFLHINYNLSFFFLYILGYYFDCIDGPMARRYDMVTTFGDFYDHFTDVFCFLWSFIIYIKKLHLLEYYYISGFYLFMFLGLLGHVGCQEKRFNASNDYKDVSLTLYVPMKLITDPEKQMKVFKYFSFTIFVLFHVSVSFLIG